MAHFAGIKLQSPKCFICKHGKVENKIIEITGLLIPEAKYPIVPKLNCVSHLLYHHFSNEFVGNQAEGIHTSALLFIAIEATANVKKMIQEWKC